MLTGSDAGEVQMWDATSGTPIPEAVWSASSRVTALAYSRDGRRFAVGYVDGTSRLFDAAQMQPLGPPIVQRSAIAHVSVSTDGESWMTILADGSPRTWRAPVALTGTPAELALRFQVDTSLALQGSTRIQLLVEPWRQRRSRLSTTQHETSGDGAASRNLARPDAVWHDARAQDAEEVGDWLTARWHLDRLVSLCTDDWLLYARRGRTQTQELAFRSANNDYGKAEQLLRRKGEERRLGLWYRQRASACQSSDHSAAAKWYLDRLIVGRSGIPGRALP